MHELRHREPQLAVLRGNVRNYTHIKTQVIVEAIRHAKAFVYVCRYACTYVHACIRACVRAHACMHGRTDGRTDGWIYMDAYIQTDIQTHRQAGRQTRSGLTDIHYLPTHTHTDRHRHKDDRNLRFHCNHGFNIRPH